MTDPILLKLINDYPDWQILLMDIKGEIFRTKPTDLSQGSLVRLYSFIGALNKTLAELEMNKLIEESSQ